ncbi:hypothetical protein GUA87_05785 [Sneathiella sp. P13V-1]|uniref:divergent polysaccharide deacetylase family protein n=1 Tax=Sneathiella sp. P13V-1 TaxID=2697366 RepID=UPI00187B2109|nr:divergent polysaccharide deacetylase family protein [Sneathiella sp. P13V-1]MBE7636347.1 hypothetical protein [Sneathiella sp. P13V-1]
MTKNKRPKNRAPAKSRKLSVLSFLYGVLILGLASIAGYAFYQQKSTPDEGRITATVSIADTVKGKHEGEVPPSRAAKEEPPVQIEEPTPKAEVTVEEPAALEKPEDPEVKDIAVAETKSEDKQTETPAPAPEKTAEPTETVRQEEPISEPEQIQKPTEEKPVEPQPVKEEPTAEEKPQPVEPEKAEVTETLASPPEEEKKAEPTVKEEAPKTPEVTPEPKIAQEPPKPVGPLPPVPDPSLAAKSDFGLLPVISPDGRKPWRVYARPFDDPLSRPRIAIIIGDMGMSKFATRSAIQDLPGEITLSFNPYGRDLQNWVAQARAAGHETLLQLPMEPFGYPDNDPGPQSLLSRLTDKENLNRLEWMLGRFTGYSGVTNQMGSRFTTSSEDISPIMDVIRDRGLLFVDGRTSGRSVAGYVAKQKSVPVAINNRFISNRADRASIDQRLAELERIARITGVAIGVGYPYPVTLERLAVWTKSLTRKGLVLAPVSAVVNSQEIQ